MNGSKLKILWFTTVKGGPRGRSRRVHFDFVYKLKKYCNCDLVLYGPGTHEENSIDAPLLYSKKITAADLMFEFVPDIVICYEAKLVRMLLPLDFCKIPVPKILIQTEAMGYGKWFAENRFDMIIRRGKLRRGLLAKDKSVPSVWVPFSVSKQICEGQDVNFDCRLRRIGFVGTLTKPEHSKYEYEIREKAAKILEAQTEFFDVLGWLGYKSYPYILRTYRCFITCTSMYHGPVAKIFEIMASGAVLLTSWFHGCAELFGHEQCFFMYRDNCEDLVDVASHIMYDVDRSKDMINRATNIINAYHLDEHRVVELFNIFKSLIEGRCLPYRWGS